MKVKEQESSVRHYFVDEAGDGVLFDKHGRVIIGQEGCSRFFILGMLDVPNPEALGRELEALRAKLLADPYFKGVPSFQPEAGKTVLAFHAKDDVPEVRKEIFSLLLRHDLHFFAVVSDKSKVMDYVKQRGKLDPAYHYHPNELYDYLVRLLFKTRLHQEERYRITFAKRGKVDRTVALINALKTTRDRFLQEHKKVSRAAIEVIPGVLVNHSGLQAVDYFLWALQRLYERREERYVTLLWPAFSLVHDRDDTRQAPYGVYYTKEKPLRLAALKTLPGI